MYTICSLFAICSFQFLRKSPVFEALSSFEQKHRLAVSGSSGANGRIGCCDVYCSLWAQRFFMSPARRRMAFTAIAGPAIAGWGSFRIRSRRLWPGGCLRRRWPRLSGRIWRRLSRGAAPASGGNPGSVLRRRPAPRRRRLSLSARNGARSWRGGRLRTLVLKGCAGRRQRAAASCISRAATRIFGRAPARAAFSLSCTFYWTSCLSAMCATSDFTARRAPDG